MTRAPCFMLHPCRTAARMRLLGSGAPAAGPGRGAPAAAALAALAPACRYAIAWFSLVAPLLGLPLLPAGGGR